MADNSRILIADDHPLVRGALWQAVAGAVPDAIISEAGDMIELSAALEKAKGTDLVLLDLNMPVMDGEQFARELRNRPDMQDVAVVVVSTEANRERLERMRELGVKHTLRKPFEPEALCRLISDVLGLKPSYQ